MTPIRPVCPLCNSDLQDLSADFNDSFSEYQCQNNINNIYLISHYYKIRASGITTIILPPFIITSSSDKTIINILNNGKLNQLDALPPIDPFNSIQINDIFSRFNNLLAFL